jgi:hypothetical protein
MGWELASKLRKSREGEGSLPANCADFADGMEACQQIAQVPRRGRELASGLRESCEGEGVPARFVDLREGMPGILANPASLADGAEDAGSQSCRGYRRSGQQSPVDALPATRSPGSPEPANPFFRGALTTEKSVLSELGTR